MEHKEQPQFCTELAWELDRRTLHQHRLVLCFLIIRLSSYIFFLFLCYLFGVFHALQTPKDSNQVTVLCN